jgi:hypothetical protein
MSRFLLLIALFALTLATLAQSAPAAVAAPQAQAVPFLYFPETGHNVGPPIKAAFDAFGGVAILGLPLTELIQGSDGTQVQYFERARFEYYPTAAPNARVVLTRVGALLTAGREQEAAFQWRSGSDSPDRDFFAESGHTLGGAFRWFWQTRGGVQVFGFPISEELIEVNPLDGHEYIVQYFERARFEYHPERAGTDQEVQLAHLGRELLQRDPLALAATGRTRPIELIGQASTGFNASSRDRVINITRATAMSDGIVVPQGAEFSFLSIGDFSEANGFVDGYAIVGGRLEKVIGGGLCQVSTTMFRAVSNAGLQITRRVGHSHIVSFYENILGFDATVFSPSVDFRWRNDSPGPVYIAGIVDEQSARMTFQIFGVSDGRSVTYDGPAIRNRRNPGVAVWQLDRTLPEGAVRQLVRGRAGMDVSYTRIIRLADGTTRRNTYNTNYKPWEDFFLYGPGVTPPAGVKVIPPRN